jgi:hypothetical protein
VAIERCDEGKQSEPAHPVSLGSVSDSITKRSACPRIRLMQEELAFIKDLTTLELSPAVLKELRKALTTRHKKKPAVSAGSRSTTPGGGSNIPQLPSGQLAGKRKANKLSSSGDSFEPANSRPVPGAGSAPLPTSSSDVTDEQSAVRIRQLGPLREE